MRDMEKEISNAASVDALVTIEGIKELIYTVRGVQVMLDRDLARLYQVETRVLNQAVKRNINRFPERFMFQLTEEEWNILKSQIVTSNMSSQFVTTSLDKRPNSALPFVFTEQGVTQLSAVLRSDVAVEMSIRINDAFHAMRHFLVANAGLFQRLSGISAWRKREGYGQGSVRYRHGGLLSRDGSGDGERIEKSFSLVVRADGTRLPSAVCPLHFLQMTVVENRAEG